MSSSSDTSVARRPPRADIAQDPPAAGCKRSSRYEIYGAANRPFGESYRRSLLLHNHDSEDTGQLPPDSPLDTDSVEDMGCSTSRTKLAEEGKGTFQTTPGTPGADAKPGKSLLKVNGTMMKTTLNIKNNGLSDFEIIYGTDNKSNTDEGYSTADIYSEVKKPEKSEIVQKRVQYQDQTPREKLMQQIRDRKDDTREGKENGYCSFAMVEKTVNENVHVKGEDVEETFNIKVESNAMSDESAPKKTVIEPVSFVEEEYSYEPGKEEVTNKLVVRSRSLVNLEQSQANAVNRPNMLKMTTKPDGTIRYGLGNSEDIQGDSPPPDDSGAKSNYVSSIRSAFDAAFESQARESGGRAEAFDGLRQYFHDNKHGLQELLVNNNVVIIEPYRPDPPSSPSDKSDTSQRTCRITGATVKSPTGEQKPFVLSNTLPRRNTKAKPAKQGFYHPIKVNKELIDAELPDPDKVKNAKELFEKIFRSRSSAEVKSAPRTFFNTITSKMRITPEVKVVQQSEKKKHNRLLIDDMKGCSLQRRWTDSGSLSSGVSSDLSYEQDSDFYRHESPTLVEEYSSDDDAYVYPYDDTDTHPVSSEVLQKIRACGTTVTYYGGRIISRSHGPLRSPMTLTIMDEIRRHGGTHESRKRFEEEPTLGVKFRLVKSHSCGSRLEITGTEEDSASQETMASPRHESLREESIAEEVAEPREQTEENLTSLEEEEDKAEADRYSSEMPAKGAPPVMTWADMKLKEARRLWHCAPEAVRAPPQDMEFETFEVLEDPQHKQDKGETGRG